MVENKTKKEFGPCTEPLLVWIGARYCERNLMGARHGIGGDWRGLGKVESDVSGGSRE